MADKISLQFENRTVIGKKVKRLRREGILPATVYGKGVGPFSVQVDARTFNSVLRQAGGTSLVELTIPGQPKQSAFIHALQRHPVTRNIIHADLLVVDLRVAMTVQVPVHAVGESDLVKRGDAVLNQLLTALDVHALPAEIPSAVEVDISPLDSLDKSIHVRDITLPGQATIVTPEDEVVFSLTPPMVEEAEPVEAAEGPTEAEIVGRERKEGEEESQR